MEMLLGKVPILISQDCSILKIVKTMLKNFSILKNICTDAEKYSQRPSHGLFNRQA
jgi:hypothetical protein